MSKGTFIVAAWGGFIATLTFLFYTDFALGRADVWCGGDTTDCLREWVSALGGWAAAVGAVLAIYPLTRQIKHAREEFILNNPPRLAFRQVHLDFRAIQTAEDRRRGKFGSIFTYNCGNNDAIIRGADVGEAPFTHGSLVIYVGEHPPGALPFDRAPRANPLLPANQRLKAGAATVWRITDASMVTPSQIREALLPTSKNRIFVIGRAHYEDEHGVQRQSIFCRAWDPKRGRFMPTDDPDYEYVT